MGMPQPTQTELDSLTSLAGEAAIYINCTKPADGADVALTDGVPAGGTWVGMTQDAAEWSYKPTISGVKIEQTNLEVAPRITDEELTLSFKAAEAVYDKLKLALQGATFTDTPNTGTTPGKRTLSVGGLTQITTQCVVLVSKIGSYVYMATTVNLYEWFVLYNAVSVDGVKVPYQRNATRMLQISLKGYGDPTRTVGDHLGKWGAQYDGN